MGSLTWRQGLGHDLPFAAASLANIGVPNRPDVEYQVHLLPPSHPPLAAAHVWHP
eukprot:CAMPEP_0172731206 /NCGR_PEP_ID=MMETSP1074-20121228/100569_1 /TAXON_ID=2916 /ORGANISM="Ceratium fusus, Strain PA161109" /LENGTH=54 /DNA_ID=CAMNT_0013559149 /DNA_START=1 /DNA_END=165 /DNA_ORIENTATION=+